MQDYFLKQRINYLNRDLELIWYRFDKDQDGRISFKEVYIKYNKF